MTQLTPRRRSSTLCKEPERCREFLEDVPDFEELFLASRKSFAEVQGMLDEFLLGDSTPEENSTETTKYNNKTKEVTNDAGTSVDKAFADLLGS